MELQEFIKNTLVSIKNGLHDANTEISKQTGTDTQSFFVLEPNNRDKTQGYIIFDVAVTVSQENKQTGGGGIKIAVVSLGGEVGNVSSQENISRIKFHVIPQIYIS